VKATPGNAEEGLRLIVEVVRAARRLVKANGCLAGGASKLHGYPPCKCTYCDLRDAFEALDAHGEKP
jgi:hypothetical protein